MDLIQSAFNAVVENKRQVGPWDAASWLVLRCGDVSSHAPQCSKTPLPTRWNQSKINDQRWSIHHQTRRKRTAKKIIKLISAMENAGSALNQQTAIDESALPHSITLQSIYDNSNQLELSQTLFFSWFHLIDLTFFLFNFINFITFHFMSVPFNPISGRWLNRIRIESGHLGPDSSTWINFIHTRFIQRLKLLIDR